MDPSIFELAQNAIDKDSSHADAIKSIVKDLDRKNRNLLAILSRVHLTSAENWPSLCQSSLESVERLKSTISQLQDVASQHSFYKYNHLWSTQMSICVQTVLLRGWLGGLSSSSPATLVSIENVCSEINIPSQKDDDTFHLTIEEYLQAIISLLEELSRLAVNMVTLDDYKTPIIISQFLKEVHAAFQVLNLKNDGLRRRFDSIKYSVQRTEQVVYDLSLRGLSKPA